MTTGRITKRSVEAISLPPAGKREFLWDDTLKNFGVMVTPSGARSYVVQYRMGGREQPTQRLTIGTHGSPWTAEKARAQAIELLEMVRKGVDHKAAQATKRDEEVATRKEQDELAFTVYADMFHPETRREEEASQHTRHRSGVQARPQAALR